MDVNISECLSRVDIPKIVEYTRALSNAEVQERIRIRILDRKFDGFPWKNLLEFHIGRSISHIHEVCRDYLIANEINNAANAECGWEINPLPLPYVRMGDHLYALDAKFHVAQRTAINAWIAAIDV